MSRNRSKAFRSRVERLKMGPAPSGSRSPMVPGCRAGRPACQCVGWLTHESEACMPMSGWVTENEACFSMRWLHALSDRWAPRCGGTGACDSWSHSTRLRRARRLSGVIPRTWGCFPSNLEPVSIFSSDFLVFLENVIWCAPASIWHSGVWCCYPNGSLRLYSCVRYPSRAWRLRRLLGPWTTGPRTDPLTTVSAWD